MKYIIDVPKDRVSKGGKLELLCEVENSLPQYIHTAIDAKPYAGDRKTIEDEIWEFVKKIECMTINEMEDCFDIEYEGIPFIANMFSYQEAKAKYEEWLKQKDEIHVGDEVQFTDVTNTIITLVVTRVDDSRFDGINNKGRLYIDRTNNLWRKTGRHFDEVEELLKKMGGDKE